jgi:hypothetical protein
MMQYLTDIECRIRRAITQQDTHVMLFAQWQKSLSKLAQITADPTVAAFCLYTLKI